MEEVEGAFTFEIRGKNIEFGKTLAEFMDEFDATTCFGNDSYSLEAGTSSFEKLTLNSGDSGTFFVGGYNDTGVSQRSPDELKFQFIKVDLLSTGKNFFTLKDGITFGATYEDILRVFGTPSDIKNIIAGDLFWDYEGCCSNYSGNANCFRSFHD